MPVSLFGYEFSLQGLLDRINLFCLGLSASGWLTFIVAFGANILSIDPVVRSLSFLFVPWWVAAFAGPAFYVLAGLYYFLNHFSFGKLFGGASAFVAVIYMGALAAPMFAVATLIAGAAGAIEDAVEAIPIPSNIIEDVIPIGGLGGIPNPLDGLSIEDALNLSPFNFIGDVLDDVISLLREFIRGILYFILVIFFEKFLTGVRGQFIGSFTAMFFLILSMMTWPFIHHKKGEKKKLC